MKWIKKGLVCAPDTSLSWSQHYCILPTPEYLENEGIIRVYYATTDNQYNGRITYIDLDAENPSHVIARTNEIILDVGSPGCFDDSGVNPSSIVNIQGEKYMFYIGYQRMEKVPYLLLAGLAKFDKKLGRLIRHADTPILERNSKELFIRSATTILKEEGIYHMWYVAGSSWEHINTEVMGNKMLPNYAINYTYSKDGLNWNNPVQNAINYLNDDEFGFGRPWIIKHHNKYYLFYSVRRRNVSYRIGVATSLDRCNWIRQDETIGLDISVSGWDSQMLCYPSIVSVRDKMYLFYNGNYNGKTGFGYAELDGDLL